MHDKKDAVGWLSKEKKLALDGRVEETVLLDSTDLSMVDGEEGTWRGKREREEEEGDGEGERERVRKRRRRKRTTAALPLDTRAQKGGQPHSQTRSDRRRQRGGRVRL